MNRNRILVASAALALLPVFAWAAGAIPDLNTQIRQKGLGKEYFLGHNIPKSSSQASFVAAVAEEHAAGGGTVHVVADTPISSAVTVPSDVKVIVESGAKFLKQTGGSLTFQGPVEVTDSSAFYGFDGAGVDGGASDLIFGSPATIPLGTYIHSSGVLGSTPELLIEGNAAEPATNYYMRVIAHGVSNEPDGRDLFSVGRWGGVKVWDYLSIHPGVGIGPSDAESAMLMIASDLGQSGVGVSMVNNVNHHDLFHFWDAGPGGSFTGGAARLMLSAAGVLSFGSKVSGVPALKPSGAELQVRLGDDSAGANLRAENITTGNNITAGGGITSSSDTIYSNNLYSRGSTTLRLDGAIPDGASAVAVRSNAGYALTTAGSKIHSFQVVGSEKSNFDRNGQVQIGIGNTSPCDTCASGIRGQICYVGGGAGVKDTVSVCAKDAGNAYAWRTIY